VLAEGVLERRDDPRVLDRGGWWAVVLTFEGDLRLYRFAQVRPAPLPVPLGAWLGPWEGEWTSSLDADDYRTGVEVIRDRIRDGDVYQVNLCRVLSAPIGADADPWALAALLARGNPAPYSGVIDVPAAGAHRGDRVVCASPELFLGRDGRRVTSSPIKGTAVDATGLLPKDEAENVMIVDLVRNDLQRVCVPGSVEVVSLLEVEQHPGLVHWCTSSRPSVAGWWTAPDGRSCSPRPARRARCPERRNPVPCARWRIWNPCRGAPTAEAWDGWTPRRGPAAWPSGSGRSGGTTGG
jgi:para-aminobenzoate synthetase component 1